MPAFTERLRSAWNVFRNNDERPARGFTDYGVSYSSRPYVTRNGITTGKTIIGSIYTRLAIDFANIPIRHVRVDGNGRFVENISSGLNNCLVVEANVDQAAGAFRQDIAMSLFEEGVKPGFPTPGMG